MVARGSYQSTLQRSLWSPPQSCDLSVRCARVPRSVHVQQLAKRILLVAQHRLAWLKCLQVGQARPRQKMDEVTALRPTRAAMRRMGMGAQRSFSMRRTSVPPRKWLHEMKPMNSRQGQGANRSDSLCYREDLQRNQGCDGTVK